MDRAKKKPKIAAAGHERGGGKDEGTHSEGTRSGKPGQKQIKRGVLSRVG